MPILIKPISVLKNMKNAFSLNKASLAAIPLIEANSYFGDESNWKRVAFHYKSNEGNQRETVVFNISETTPAASFFVSGVARGNFTLEHIVIHDFDGGHLTINRNSIPDVTEMDVALPQEGGGGGGGNPAEPDFDNVPVINSIVFETNDSVANGRFVITTNTVPEGNSYNLFIMREPGMGYAPVAYMSGGESIVYIQDLDVSDYELEDGRIYYFKLQDAVSGKNSVPFWASWGTAEPIPFLSHVFFQPGNGLGSTYDRFRLFFVPGVSQNTSYLIQASTDGGNYSLVKIINHGEHNSGYSPSIGSINFIDVFQSDYEFNQDNYTFTITSTINGIASNELGTFWSGDYSPAPANFASHVYYYMDGLYRIDLSWQAMEEQHRVYRINLLTQEKVFIGQTSDYESTITDDSIESGVPYEYLIHAYTIQSGEGLPLRHQFSFNAMHVDDLMVGAVTINEISPIGLVDMQTGSGDFTVSADNASFYATLDDVTGTITLEATQPWETTVVTVSDNITGEFFSFEPISAQEAPSLILDVSVMGTSVPSGWEPTHVVTIHNNELDTNQLDISFAAPESDYEQWGYEVGVWDPALEGYPVYVMTHEFDTTVSLQINYPDYEGFSVDLYSYSVASIDVQIMTTEVPADSEWHLVAYIDNTIGTVDAIVEGAYGQPLHESWNYYLSGDESTSYEFYMMSTAPGHSAEVTITHSMLAPAEPFMVTSAEVDGLPSQED
jgi:hypothetical protein